MADEHVTYKLELQDLLSQGLKDAKAHALELQQTMGNLQGNFNEVFKTLNKGVTTWQQDITMVTNLRNTVKELIPTTTNLAKTLGSDVVGAVQKMGQTVSTQGGAFDGLKGKSKAMLDVMLGGNPLTHIENGFKQVTQAVNHFSLDGLQKSSPHLKTFIKSTHDSTIAMLEHKGVLGEANKVLDMATAGLNTASRAINIVKDATTLWKEGTKAMETVQLLLNAAMEANPIGAIIVLVGLIAAAIYEAYQHFDGFRKAVDIAWEILKGLGSFISDVFMGELNVLKFTIMGIADALTFDFSGAKENFKNAGEVFSKTATSIGDDLKKTKKDAEDVYNTDYSKKVNTPAKKSTGATSGAAIASALSPQDAMAERVTGTKQTVIHLNISKMTGIEKATFSNIKESANTAGETLLKALLNTVNQASASADI